MENPEHKSVPLEYVSLAKPPSDGRWSQILTVLTVFCVIALCVGALCFFVMIKSGRPRETAYRIKCAANLKTLGQLLIQYAADNGDRFPPTLNELILDRNTDFQFLSGILICPTSKDIRAVAQTRGELITKLAGQSLSDAKAAAKERPWAHSSYIYVGGGWTMPAPAEAVLAYEPISNHAGDGINVLYGDGHVDFIGTTTALKLIAELQARHTPPLGEIYSK